MKQTKNNPIPASFRDPSGHVFLHNGEYHRLIRNRYKEDYDLLMSSGLYKDLTDKGLLVPHQEVPPTSEEQDTYKVIRPEQIPFISYPYEWSFSQLKAAALVTLRIQKMAMKHGMSLKDCSAYNIQFIGARPVFIDTLSFEALKPGAPWTPYRQFCQHFLAPLALMSRRDIRLNQLLRVHLDGIPLDLASRLLPLRSRLSPSLLFHLHLHAKSQQRYENKKVSPTKKAGISQNAFLGLIDSLKTAVEGLTWRPAGTEWAEYYNDTNYSDEAMEFKKKTIAEFLDSGLQGPVWDLGANTGVFSRIAAEKGFQTIAFDVDPGAVELNYLACAKEKQNNLLPLLLDLANPSSDIGWANEERMSFTKRGPAGTVMALALIHHLAISNNLPLEKIAEYFSRISRHLIIEFVPKTDSNAQRLLVTRKDIFTGYDQPCFDRAFSKYFKTHRSTEIPKTDRTLYHMEVISGYPSLHPSPPLSATTRL